jgi:hypothetical protein
MSSGKSIYEKFVKISTFPAHISQRPVSFPINAKRFQGLLNQSIFHFATKSLIIQSSLLALGSLSHLSPLSHLSLE